MVFFWPAAGIAALWMLDAQNRQQVLLDATLLVAGTTVLDVILGVDLLPSLLFGIANLTVGLTVRVFSSLSEGASFWGRLPRANRRPP